ncbi:MAG TPA: hypothetical protein VNO31_22015 [Umezawaea sp.]|nr:hypothetical protein [Umezawaea sp.]
MAVRHRHQECRPQPGDAVMTRLTALFATVLLVALAALLLVVRP